MIANDCNFSVGSSFIAGAVGLFAANAIEQSRVVCEPLLVQLSSCLSLLGLGLQTLGGAEEQYAYCPKYVSITLICKYTYLILFVFR